MRLLIIFILLCVIIKNSIQRLKYYEEDNVTAINQILCVKREVGKYFRDYTNILLFSRDDDSNDIVNSLPKVPLFLVTQWDIVRKTLFDDKGAMIIFLEGNSYQDFQSLKRLRSIVVSKPVLMVCITDAICSSEMYINKIVKTVHVSIELRYIALNNQGIINIYEYTTTTDEACGSPQFLRLGNCSDVSTTTDLLQTSVNYHQCPIRVITWYGLSYTKPCHFDEPNQKCGMEGKAVQFLMEKINATIDLLIVQSSADVRLLVANRYADLGFGLLDTRATEGISYSKSYLFIKATVVALHSTWTLEGWMENILLPFEFQVWIGIGVVIVLLFILRIFLPHFQRIDMVELFGILLGHPVSIRPRELSIRIYFLSLVLFGYICSQSYLTHLTKVFSIPEQQAILTLDDLESSNLRVAGYPEARKKFQSDYPRIYEDFQVLDFPDYRVKVSKLLTGDFRSPIYIEITDYSISNWKGVRAIENGISWYPVSLATVNSGSFLKTTNKFLAQITESGILLVDPIVYLAINHSKNHNDSTLLEGSGALEFRDLDGVFFVLVTGLAISFLVFIIEIISPHTKTKANQLISKYRY